MKELSIEEKAKRYDEALKVLHKYDGANIMFSQSLKEEMFPELRESEDERIRKWIIGVLSTYEHDRDLRNVALAWLKKQDEQKFEQKFFINDKVVHKATGKIWTIHHYLKDTNSYYVEDNDGLLHHYIESELKLVEQKPAWSEEDELHIRELENLVKQVWATAERENDKDKIHKMSNLSFFLKTLKPQLKQEWSEDDIRILTGITNYIGCSDLEGWEEWYNWLKFLKGRVQPKHQTTWKPDSAMIVSLQYAINHIHKETKGGINYDVSNRCRYTTV